MNKFAVIIALAAVLVGLVAISSVSAKKPHEHFEHEGGEIDRPHHHPRNQVEHEVPRAHHGKPPVHRQPVHHRRPKPVHHYPQHPRGQRRPQQQPVCAGSRNENQVQVGGQGGEFEQNGEFVQGGEQGGESERGAEFEQGDESEEPGQEAGRGRRREPSRGAGVARRENDFEQGDESEEPGQEGGRGRRREPSRGAGVARRENDFEQGGEPEEQGQESGRGRRRELSRGAGVARRENDFEQGGEPEEQGQEGGRGRRRGSFKGAGSFGAFKREEDVDAGVRADAKQRNRNQFQKNKGVFAGDQKQFNAGASNNENQSVDGFHRQKNVNNDRLVVKETSNAKDDAAGFHKQSGSSQEGHIGGSENKFFGAQVGESGSSDQESERDFGAGVHKKSSVGGFGGAGAVKGQF